MNNRTIRFMSFEEGLALLGALIISALFYTFAGQFFSVPLLASFLIAALVVIAIAYITFFEFTLRNEVIIYRNRFRRVSFPLEHVKKVSMRTFWGGLPGHTFMFLMRCPPHEFNGRSYRTGLVSWPSASGWVDAVNSAVRAKAHVSDAGAPEKA